MNFKDLFSKQAKDYAQYRPHYPSELFSYLASLPSSKKLAWDCGTGNGQAAVMLAEHFEHVIATDPAENQLRNAEKNSKVTYEIAPAEHSPLKDQSADLITVAQAFHWFKHAQFFAEVKRVLKPDGILAIWCYNLCKVTPAVDEVIHHFYTDTLGRYWENERRLVEEGYQNTMFPFLEIQHPSFEMKADWTIEHLIGYLGTWSALQTYINRNNGSDPLKEIEPLLRKAWGKGHALQPVKWVLSMRIGRSDC